MQEKNSLSIKELDDIVGEIISGVERLPPHAMMQPITQYDFLSLLHLFRSFIRADLDEIE